MIENFSMNEKEPIKGIIFDIKEFSLHDGPGGRTTVFLKGCPLRCRWCHNPEGLKKEPQLMVKQSLCKHCGLCRVPCEHPECKPYGRCIHACPEGLLSVTGKEVSAKDLALQLGKQKDFWIMSGGGVTVSGGEPLLQADFVCELLDLMGNVHKTIETCGYASSEDFLRVISKVDLVLMDIKVADPVRHQELTGVSNDKILRNLQLLKESGKAHVLRVPLIPHLTDTEENLKAIAELAGDSPVELLKYNVFAGAKYDMLGMTYPDIDSHNQEVDLGWFKNAKFG